MKPEPTPQTSHQKRAGSSLLLLLVCTWSALWSFDALTWRTALGGFLITVGVLAALAFWDATSRSSRGK